MHLILGHSADPCCSGIEARLAARGLTVCVTAMPLAPPSRLVLRIGSEGEPIRPEAAISLDEGLPSTIDSVLVRTTGGLDPSGWEPADHAYMQAEAHAVLLAWLASLDCPVVNRMGAELWYRPRNPLLAWAPLLRRCGLPAPETIVTSDPDVARDFRRRLEADGTPGAVCTTLARDGAWLVGPDDWAGVAGLQSLAPVCLTEPHGRVRSACLVGGTLIWGTPPDPAEAAFEQPMRRFAAAAGLVFVEFGVARVRRGPAIVHVDPLPRLENFPRQARSRILDALTAVLAGDTIPAGDLAEAPA